MEAFPGAEILGVRTLAAPEPAADAGDEADSEDED
jgi:hypothetical protein